MHLRLVLFFLFILLGPFKSLNAYLLPEFTHQDPSGLMELELEEDHFDKVKNEVSKIKFYILNGHIKQARMKLESLDLKKDNELEITLKLMAMISFFEKRYEKTQELLNLDKLNSAKYFPQICLLKVLTLIKLNKSDKASLNWKMCKDKMNSLELSRTLWADIMLGLKETKNPFYIDQIFEKISLKDLTMKDLETYLKLGLYLNQHKKIVPHFKYFSNEVLEDNTLRELMALNYYRNNELTKAYQLFEPLETTNAKVFKGDLYIFQKLYTQAYAQFKTALLTKPFSQNTIDRVIPLSWKLARWKDGLEFLQRKEILQSDYYDYLSLKSVFLIMNDQYKESKKTLLKTYSNSVVNLQMHILTHLALKEYTQMRIHTKKACHKHDPFACWISVMTNTWSTFFKLVNTKTKIHENVSDLEKELLNENSIPKFKDINLVDQKYIEELDNNLLKLN